MVVYKQDNTSITWYSFLKQNGKLTEHIADDMLQRFINSRFNDQHTNKILFFNNLTDKLVKEI